jgi:hypothetical protein
MRISRTFILASTLAITALVIGAAVYFPKHTSDAATPIESTAPVATTTLEPVVVLATR